MKKPGLLEKLIVAYAVFVIVLLGLAVFLVFVSSRLGNVTADIYYLDQHKKEVTDKLINDLISLEETSKQYLLLQKESYRTVIDQREESITRAWEYLCLDGVCTDENEIRAVKSGMQVWGQHLERFHALLAQPPTDTETLDRIFRDNSRSMDSMVKVARLINAGTLESLDNKIVLLKSLGEQIKLFTWWALGIAATIGLIIPLLIYKSITNDLMSIRTGIRHIAHGDFSYRIPLYSKDELGMLAESFNTMSLRLKELDNMKSEFISIVSHELRTPLTSMKEAANLLMEGLTGELNERQKRLITIMQQGMDRLLQMISELLEISKLESGMVELQIGPHNINEVVSGFHSEIQPYAGKKGIEIKISYLPEGLTVPLDRNKILRVLTNLTQNAIKYSGEGAEVELRLIRQNDHVTIEIEDHGIGIPDEDIPLIFEKFYQSKATRGHSGIGLGLAISRSIVDAHGGNIYAKSTIGKGSVFSFSLPVHPPLSAGGVHGQSVRQKAQAG
ncbi:MAG TPA: HAMP domain-containing sensor histidine kinase [Deltaproteobacteria bacterium]|jgi:signal transduction histidine kinase|nr:HAMP domain-containing sensor histidine kinase [Deltaproteobacteria bacterium]HOI07980.1 HAMP domain-containing sensor histidine kinase [Deltaproteobacteria bacterium]